VALTLLYGETEASLLAALTEARNDLKKGKMLITGNSGDVQAGYALQSSARSRIEMLQHALYELDSDTYADFACAGHSQTVATFNTSTSSTDSDS
jgi:hypothetical protein